MCKHLQLCPPAEKNLPVLLKPGGMDEVGLLLDDGGPAMQAEHLDDKLLHEDQVRLFFPCHMHAQPLCTDSTDAKN
jgi:hypothetical protein